jgi:hypothetical protein
VKAAETDWLLESTSLHEEPLQAPPKPAKVKPDAATDVMVTAVPEGKLAVQAVGQVMPAGLLLTVPLPVTTTASCTCGEVDWPEPPPQAVNSKARHKGDSNKRREDTE